MNLPRSSGLPYPVHPPLRNKSHITTRVVGSRCRHWRAPSLRLRSLGLNPGSQAIQKKFMKLPPQVDTSSSDDLDPSEAMAYEVARRAGPRKWRFPFQARDRTRRVHDKNVSALIESRHGHQGPRDGFWYCENNASSDADEDDEDDEDFPQRDVDADERLRRERSFRLLPGDFPPEFFTRPQKAARIAERRARPEAGDAPPCMGRQNDLRARELNVTSRADGSSFEQFADLELEGFESLDVGMLAEDTGHRMDLTPECDAPHILGARGWNDVPDKQRTEILVDDPLVEIRQPPRRGSQRTFMHLPISAKGVYIHRQRQIQGPRHVPTKTGIKKRRELPARETNGSGRGRDSANSRRYMTEFKAGSWKFSQESWNAVDRHQANENKTAADAEKAPKFSAHLRNEDPDSCRNQQPLVTMRDLVEERALQGVRDRKRNLQDSTVVGLSSSFSGGSIVIQPCQKQSGFANFKYQCLSSKGEESRLNNVESNHYNAEESIQWERPD